MWRKLAAMLFLMVLAQTANASPIENLYKDSSKIHISAPHLEQKNAFTLDNDESNELFNLPRLNRLSPSLFSTEIQTSPSYFLIVEFCKSKLSAALFKNLINPPLSSQWYEQFSVKNKSSRISGWKDGNFLFSSRITYHS